MRMRPIAPGPAALIAIALFVAAAALLWRPFDSYTVLYGTRPGGAVPAGEIRADFELVQQVRPPVAIDASPSAGQQHCFAIRFATYARRNSGHLQVHWRQGPHAQSWRVRAADLADNTYRHFCPDAAFANGRPFQVRISGLDSEPGNAATLWLVADTRFGTARLLPAELPQGKSMALQGSTRNRVEAGEMVRINGGAYLIGWLCTLAIAILALARTFGRRGQNDD